MAAARGPEFHTPQGERDESDDDGGVEEAPLSAGSSLLNDLSAFLTGVADPGCFQSRGGGPSRFRPGPGMRIER